MRKKIILFSSFTLLCAALLVWYFFPILAFKWFWYQSDALRPYLISTPVPLSTLKTPPKNWQEISIGALAMKLPMTEYNKVGGTETEIYFVSDRGRLTVLEIVPSNEMINMIKENKRTSYQHQVEIYKSTPADISFFNSRSKNMSAVSNQMVKVMAIPIGGISKVLTVDAENLKALCILSEQRKNGYHATVDVYSKDEKASLLLMFHAYKDVDTLETDILAVLGGMKMFDKIPDRKHVIKDINYIVTKFNKT